MQYRWLYAAAFTHALDVLFVATFCSQAILIVSPMLHLCPPIGVAPGPLSGVVDGCDTEPGRRFFEQPTLFELHEDHRPPGERNAAERYCEPSLFTLMERPDQPRYEQESFLRLGGNY